MRCVYMLRRISGRRARKVWKVGGKDGAGFRMSETPWLLLSRRGDDPDETILNEMCRLVRRTSCYVCVQGCCLLCSCLRCRTICISIFTHGMKNTVENVHLAQPIHKSLAIV